MSEKIDIFFILINYYVFMEFIQQNDEYDNIYNLRINGLLPKISIDNDAYDYTYGLTEQQILQLDMFDKKYQEDVSAASEPRIPGRYHRSRPSRYPTTNELNKMMDLAITSKEETKIIQAHLENLNKNGTTEESAQSISLLLKEKRGVESEIISFVKQSEEIDISEIQYLAADSYGKAAFAAYVLGRFEDAVNYQSKALKFNSTSENRFILSKYQVRNNNIKEAIDNLDKSINDKPIYAIAAFKELDLINEPEVIKLIAQKNDAIDHKIKQLTEKWKTVESTKASEVIKELTKLSKKSYEIKITDFNKYEKEGDTINTGVTELEVKIDAYINDVKQITYCTFDADKIQKIIKELQLAKDLPIEKMLEIFNRIKKQVDADKLQVGSKYSGGIVFYINESGKHGLMCAEFDFGIALWGARGEIGASGKGLANGGGISNTKKIVELASWYIEKSWFNTTKTPVPTAARLCLESNHNGFSDWYLPTEKELELMYKTLKIKNIGNLKSDFYWSSQESDANSAFSVPFIEADDIINVPYFREDLACVRAVRIF
jgi:tetratricopeptide (TPR) repeat protein